MASPFQCGSVKIVARFCYFPLEILSACEIEVNRCPLSIFSSLLRNLIDELVTNLQSVKIICTFHVKQRV